MRPKNLKICAWGPYRGLEEVDFDAFRERGIFLITGATGAGKTTIFDAISYALYGSLSGEERDKERSSVRSDFADAQMPTYVELVMEHGGKVYTIKRNPEYQRPKKRGDGQTLTVQKENAVLCFSDGRILEGVREVNAALKEILVLDYQQFKKISMIAQGEFAKLLVAPPKDKTKIFREIFGTGIYERFTKGLSNRARKLYAKVEESQSKLGEDMRILTEGMEKSRWSEEAKEHLGKLAEAEYRNPEEWKQCLKNMEREAQSALKSAGERFEEADKRVEELTLKLTKQMEINRMLEQYERNQEELKLLEERAEEYTKKEQIYRDAINAQFVAGLEEKKVQTQKRLTEAIEAIKRVSEEMGELSAEKETLAPVLDKADKVRKLLETAEKEQELQLQYESELLLWKKRQEDFEKKQKDYLEKEKAYRKERENYEEAEHRRRMTAVGLAAALLEEGQPCPVCGSIEHPSPAKMQVQSISEDQLQHKKKELERMDERLREAESGMAAEGALLKNHKQKLEELKNNIGSLKGILEQERDAVCLAYLELKPTAARDKLEQQCKRAGEIDVLLQEKQEQESNYRKQCRELETECGLAKQAFLEALKQHGFLSAADYEKVKKNKAECDCLQKELSDYQNRVAACRQLKEHLKEGVQGLESQPLTLLKEALEQAKADKSAHLKVQQEWEKHKSEVKKASRLVNANLKRIEEESEKYGYVKDLENMAMGNNSKRLVFEQYVLAEYFEEILKAANLRFGKMTSGRYEMFRVEEVGDGRVKDNLEIRIMDYYTGKMRSVRTLSGGESFKASLSLALGMSDVIQAMNGGIRVDTLFVDEGFGALDSESLDQACDTLMSLVENNHLIGIISHVPQLRERIGSQLVVEKTNSGSVIKNSVY